MEYTPVIFVALALAFAVVGYRREAGRKSFAAELTKWLLFFPIGLQGLWAFLGHVFFPEQSAAAIGWQTSPFQYEVGIANLGIGIVGVLAAFRGVGFQTATALIASIFLMGAGIGHIRQILIAGNFAPDNAGPILFTDIGVPVVLLIALYVGARQRPRI
jgi:small-conductance mechanosensitive channel